MNGARMKKRVIVFVASLGSGGAERVAVNVCGWLRDAGHHVCLLTLSSVAADFYPCPLGVTRVGLDLQGPSANPIAALVANLRRLAAVRRAVRSHHADVVLSLGDRTNVLMLLALLGIHCRKVISERADPVLEPLSRGWSLLRKLVYPTASLHVAQSVYVSNWLGQQFPGLPCAVIGNAAGDRPIMPVGSIERGAGEPLRLVAVGRLTRQKGIDLLLDAFAKARKVVEAPMKLDLVGDGDDRDALVRQVEALGLSGVVTFHGRLPDVQAWLRGADVFVLSSRWEGFPNVMIEAMSVGLPLIAARCQGGVDDILGDVPERYALDYPPGDVDALAGCMVRMAGDANLRKLLARCSLERAADYGPDRVAAAWRNAVEAI